ncbi:MAG: amidohydrolase family protein [Clostridia bacterium]|nr:amidohydrolase family protein [Clostridia bacterium]
MLELARSTGVDVSVVQPIATKPSQNETINHWAASIMNDEIKCFGTVHPETENFREVVHEIKQLGLYGVKFHPEYQQFNIDDEKYYPLFEAIFNEGLPVLFHTGGDVAFRPPFRSLPQQTARMAKHFKGATIIGAHLGGFDMWEDAVENLKDSGIYVDLAVTASFVRGEMLRRIIMEYGCDKVLFGSDSPWGSPAFEQGSLAEIDLTEQQRELICYKNAERILGITL